MDEEMLWEYIPEAGASNTYPSYVKAILDLYPGSQLESTWSLGALEAEIRKYASYSKFESSSFGEYFRSFQSISSFLITSGVLSSTEQRRLFVQGIPTALWMKISQRLEIKYPDYEPGHLYSLQEVQEAAYYILRASSSSLSVPQLSAASNPALVPSNLAPEALSIIPEIHRLQEAMSQILGELQSTWEQDWPHFVDAEPDRFEPSSLAPLESYLVPPTSIQPQEAVCARCGAGGPPGIVCPCASGKRPPASNATKTS